jgi:GYF domain 2
MPDKWYYSHNELKVAGPCSSTELKRLAARGQLKPDDMVGKNRMVRLVKASSVKGLFTTPTA